MIKNLFYLTNRLGLAGYKSKSIPFFRSFLNLFTKTCAKVAVRVYFCLLFVKIYLFDVLFYKGA